MKPCIEVGCPEFAEPGRPRCRRHGRIRNAERERQPNRASYRDPAYRSIPLVGVCADCGTTDDLTRDHVIALVDGGTNDPSNVVIRCRACNSKKENERRRASER